MLEFQFNTLLLQVVLLVVQIRDLQQLLAVVVQVATEIVHLEN
tara:strand:+ start:258 stop:386 length:129 start_codon:yes stop_codon:yes gene_type:complete